MKKYVYKNVYYEIKVNFINLLYLVIKNCLSTFKFSNLKKIIKNLYNSKVHRRIVKNI